MKQQAQLIYKNRGHEKQSLKAKEERLELEIALNKLALYDLREEQGICQDVLREELITDCNEEFGDNVLMRMQFENLDFEESFEMMCDCYSKCRILHCYGIDNFYFSKEEVRKWVERKIKRTLERYITGIEIKEGMIIAAKKKKGLYQNNFIDENDIDWEETRKLNGVEYE